MRAYFADLWPLVDTVFLNRGEAERLAGSSGAEAASRLIEAGVRRVVLTLGGDGSLLAGAGAVEAVPAVVANAIDTTGAGDSFMATALASAALRGVQLDQRAVAHASAAAALNMPATTTPPAWDAVLDFWFSEGRSLDVRADDHRNHWM